MGVIVLVTIGQDHFRQGNHFQENGEWLSAIMELMQVSRDNPDYALARAGLAYCQLMVEDFSAAISVCEDLIASHNSKDLKFKLWLQFTDENPFVIQAYALFRLGEQDKACLVLETFAAQYRELLLKFFERNNKSSIWLDLCRSDIVTPLLETWRNWLLKQPVD